MQNYDEAYFRAKANKRAGTTWLMLLIIVSVYYGAKMAGGEVNQNQYIMFTVIGWLQYLGSGIFLKVKGMDEPGYKWVLGFGYLLYFAVRGVLTLAGIAALVWLTKNYQNMFAVKNSTTVNPFGEKMHSFFATLPFLLFCITIVVQAVSYLL